MAWKYEWTQNDNMVRRKLTMANKDEFGPKKKRSQFVRESGRKSMIIAMKVGGNL